MKFQKIFLAFVLSLLCAGVNLSCTDDDDPGTNPSDGGQPAPNFNTKVTTSVYGFVTDENGAPIIGADIKSGSKTTQTDNDGYFEIADADVVKGTGVVTAEETGYFKGIRTWIAEADNKQFVRIKLLPKTIAGTFSAEDGGEVSLNNGLKLSFPSNAIVEEETGTVYNGQVEVALQWIDPTANDLSEMMPGDLRAIDADGYMQGLITYGMVAAELTSPDGKKLQIAEGKTAEMRTPIEADLAANAPNEMPLWYFDEAKGLWIEEGKTTRSGNEYVGNVSHFSFWNCDVPYAFVYMQCRLVDASGNPLAGYNVNIRDNSNNRFAHSYTNQDGYISGYVPKNANLTLNMYSHVVLDTYCPIYSKDFSTGASDINLGDLTVNAEGAITNSVIKGKAYKCDNTPITRGYALLKVSNASMCRVNIVDGEYTYSLYSCTSGIDLDITVYDLDSGLANSAQISLVAGENTAPDIYACNEISHSYVMATIDGKNYIFSKIIRGFTFDGRTSLNIYNSNDYGSESIEQISISWPGGIATGTFSMEDIYVSILYKDQPQEMLHIYKGRYTTGQVNITKYARTANELGEEAYDLEGTFSVQRGEGYTNRNQSGTMTEKSFTGKIKLVNWQNLPY